MKFISDKNPDDNKPSKDKVEYQVTEEEFKFIFFLGTVALEAKEEERASGISYQFVEVLDITIDEWSKRTGISKNTIYNYMIVQIFINTWLDAGVDGFLDKFSEIVEWMVSR